MFFTLLPFQGVDDLLFVTQGVASLALGYALIGLSARLHVGTHGEKTHATLEAAALLSHMGSNLNGTWIVDTHS